MLVSWEWLCELVSGLDAYTPHRVAEELTRIGFEIEEITRWEPNARILESLIIGEIVDTLPLTNNLTKVIINTGTQHLTTISGAPNICKGNKVAVALPGSLIVQKDREQNTKVIPVAEQNIAGHLSECVLCSPAEASVGTDTSGLWLLPHDAPTGKKISQWLGGIPHDWIIDISIPPNRGDALSHLGIAREIAAALFGSQEVVNIPEVAPAPPSSTTFNIHIEDETLCKCYLLLLCNGVQVAPSPWKIQKRLLALNQSLHNNVVDISNYVMFELGQPTHPFDAKKLDGEIHVRKARRTEKAHTLDQQERQLTGEELVIASKKEVVALAGVIGCINSAISDSTEAVALESALFNPRLVRKTARTHRLSTEASYRFERQVPPPAVELAPMRWLFLMEPFYSGETYLCRYDSCSAERKKVLIPISISRISALLGDTVPQAHINKTLTALGFNVSPEADGTVTVEVPPWRSDIHHEQDIAEEYARLYGYDRLARASTIKIHLHPKNRASLFELRRRLIVTCVSMGYTEVISPPFIENSLVEKLLAGELDQIIHLQEAINKEASYMIHTPVLALLPILSHNMRHRKMHMQIAEITKTYTRKENNAFGEKWFLSLARWAGEPFPSWHTPYEKGLLFGRLLEDVTAIVRLFTGIEVKSWKAVSIPHTAVAVTAPQFESHGMPPLAVYMPAPSLLSYYKLKGELACAYIDIEWVASESINKDLRLQQPHPHPPFYRDISFIIRKEVQFGTILQEIYQALHNAVRQVYLIDLYTGKNIPEGHKSMTLRLWLMADSAESATSLALRALDIIVGKFGAKKRG